MWIFLRILKYCLLEKLYHIISSYQEYMGAQFTHTELVLVSLTFKPICIWKYYLIWDSLLTGDKFIFTLTSSLDCQLTSFFALPGYRHFPMFYSENAFRYCSFYYRCCKNILSFVFFSPEMLFISQRLYSYSVKLLLRFVNICSQFLFLPITQIITNFCLWITLWAVLL